MRSLFAAAVDVFHALSMVLWMLGVPLLFVRRWPRLTRTYAAYAVAFVVFTQLSHALFGECFLTRVAATLWDEVPSVPGGRGEWFSIRFARFVFGFTPSHRVIAWVSEALVLVTAIGVLVATGSRLRASPSHEVAGPEPRSPDNLVPKA